MERGYTIHNISGGKEFFLDIGNVPPPNKFTTYMYLKISSNGIGIEGSSILRFIKTGGENYAEIYDGNHVPPDSLIIDAMINTAELGCFCGDVVDDDVINILDVVYLINFKYKGARRRSVLFLSQT